MAKYKVPEGTVSKVYAGRHEDGRMKTRDKPVAYRVDHTNNHVNWSGRKSIKGLKMPEPITIDGTMYYKVFPDDKSWWMMGHQPKPETDYLIARSRFLHGMTMRYGFINSMCFALRWYYKGKKKKWLS